MFSKIEASERLMPQKNVVASPEALRRAANLRKKVKAARKASRKLRGQVLIPKAIVDRSAPLPRKSAPVTFAVTTPKEDVLQFENSRFYYGYRRRTCAGESCCGTRG